MNSEKLDDSNFVLFAARNYNNPGCYDKDEFIEDLSRFKYIRRLLNRYEQTGDLKERLILNHIIIIFNCFSSEPSQKMLFYKLKGHESLLKTFLEYLNLMPKKIMNIDSDNRTIHSKDIEIDESILERLRKL